MAWRFYAVGLVPVLAGVAIGLGVWGGYAGTSALIETNGFCLSCHEMGTTGAEYQASIHFANASGVRAQCADCHVPKPFVARVVHMVRATRDIVGHVRGVIDTPAQFEANRLAMAKRVWDEMGANDSLGCRSCHDFAAMDGKLQRKTAVEGMHPKLIAGKTCIDCHKGIAHHMPSLVARPAPLAVPPPAPPVVAAKPAEAPAAADAPAPAPAPAAAAAAGAHGFIGLGIVPLTASPGGATIATLYVSAPVAADGSQSGATHVTTKLWLKGDSVSAGPLYAAPNGIELGHLADAAAASGGAPADGWLPVELQGYVAADAVVADIAPVWQGVEMTFEFTCGACHVLHSPHDYAPAEWASEMATMGKSANLGPADAMLILKWLQTGSLEPKAGN